GPAMNASWLPINLPLFLHRPQADLPPAVRVAYGSAHDVGLVVTFPGNAAAAVLAPGWTGGQRMLLPATWTAMTIQELTSAKIRDARGVVFGGPLDRWPEADAFALPHLGPFPRATLPTHVVAPGDNLWNIAKDQYGSGLYYPDV